MSGNLLFKAIQTASDLLSDYPIQAQSQEEAGEGRALGGGSYSRRLNMGRLGRRVGGGLAASKLRTGAAGGGGMLASGSQREFD